MAHGLASVLPSYAAGGPSARIRREANLRPKAGTPRERHADWELLGHDRSATQVVIIVCSMRGMSRQAKTLTGFRQSKSVHLYRRMGGNLAARIRPSLPRDSRVHTSPLRARGQALLSVEDSALARSASRWIAAAEWLLSARGQERDRDTGVAGSSPRHPILFWP